MFEINEICDREYDGPYTRFFLCQLLSKAVVTVIAFSDFKTVWEDDTLLSVWAVWLASDAHLVGWWAVTATSDAHLELVSGTHLRGKYK